MFFMLIFALGGVFLLIALFVDSSRSPAASKKRLNSVLRIDASAAVKADADPGGRRKQVAEILKEIDTKAKNKASIETRLTQAGLAMTKQSFIIASCVSAVIFGLVALVLLGRLYAVGALLIGGFGLPNWTLSHLQKKRMTRFQQGFPGAVEVIIRGVKSGLPLGVCLQTVAVQAQDPVRSEFQFIVGSIGVGFTIAESVERMAERVPLPETKFFAIVINIQQKAGGNLTEALGNLSQVLRSRQTLQLKIKALSSEARASAWILGLMPFIIGGLVYLTAPTYLEPLWKTQIGQLVLTGVAIWMSMGVLTMRAMLNFKP